MCRAVSTTASLESSKKLAFAKNVNTKQPRPKVKVVSVFRGMTVQQLATAMDRTVDHVFECFLYITNTSAYDSPDSAIDDIDVLKEVVRKCGLKCQVASAKKIDPTSTEASGQDRDVYPRAPADPSACQRRPPVVTIMGHVDHGKTTLLDTLRKSNRVEQEFGGITQHIGAFSVQMKSGDTITFLDTPGHAAFSAMRNRGAQVTDIVVLVVAADDGVMPQTLECIQHAHNAGVPIIVAINKVDKREADIQRVLLELQTHGLVCEALGGEVISVPISALKGSNMEALQDAILTQADLLDIKSDSAGVAEGRVLEARTDPGRGKLATVLVQRGTLCPAAYLVAGTAYGKVRAMFDEHGHSVGSISPGTAAEIAGWRELPSPGDLLLEVESEQRMKEVIDTRLAREQAKLAGETAEAVKKKQAEHLVGYQKLLQQRLQMGLKTYRRIKTDAKEKETAKEGSARPILSIVLKGDVDGSVEAILDVLNTYEPHLCDLDIITYGIGPVTPNDIEMASAFAGIILAFNVPVTNAVSDEATTKGITIRKHNIIYKLVDDVKDLLTARLPATLVEKTVGEAAVQKVFQVTEGKRKVSVAGCRCIKGTLEKRLQFKLLRGDTVVHTGPLCSLKHFKNEVGTIKNEMECGMSFENRSLDMQVGDIVVCYELVEEKPSISWDLPF